MQESTGRNPMFAYAQLAVSFVSSNLPIWLVITGCSFGFGVTLKTSDYCQMPEAEAVVADKLFSAALLTFGLAMILLIISVFINSVWMMIGAR